MDNLVLTGLDYFKPSDLLFWANIERRSVYAGRQGLDSAPNPAPQNRCSTPCRGQFRLLPKPNRIALRHAVPALRAGEAALPCLNGRSVRSKYFRFDGAKANHRTPVGQSRIFKQVAIMTTGQILQRNIRCRDRTGLACCSFQIVNCFNAKFPESLENGHVTL